MKASKTEARKAIIHLQILSNENFNDDDHPIFLCPTLLTGEVKNGYSTKINEARLALKNLNKIIEEDEQQDLNFSGKLTARQKVKMSKTIESLEQFVRFFELTEILLEQFSSIAPELYHEIDTILDGNGDTTDVYVKFMPLKAMQISPKGITNMDYKENELL